jgi:geranylgeranyl pyrophosphate synthase
VTAGYPEHLREEVDAYLATLRFDATAPATRTLDEAMRYSLMAGGKRIRPVLALATAKAIQAPTATFLPRRSPSCSPASPERPRRSSPPCASSPRRRA